MTSKYVKALEEINSPASPKQLRKKLEATYKHEFPAQNVAAALYNLKLRKKIVQLDNGLYIAASDDSLAPI